jgi:putative transposase
MIIQTPDRKLYRNGVAFRILRYVDPLVHLENEATGAIETIDYTTMIKEYGTGVIRVTMEKTPRSLVADKSIISSAAQAEMSEPARAETRRRIDFITKLSARGAFEQGKKEICAAIAEISRERGEAAAPHVSTVYRWRKRFIKAKNDVRALLARLDLRGGKNQSRLDPQVEAIIHEKIETIYLGAKCGSAEDVYNAVFLAIQAENTKRIESEWLNVPGLRTIQRRINTLYGFDIAVARYGLKEAERRYGAVFASRRAKRILELVEIDHTPVDIMVVNEDRTVIARPTVTFVLDRFSRCILGYHLSLAGHGTPAVFEALRHALLPKTYIKDAFPNLNMEWECCGWFERLLMDNGREFHAEAVVDALISLGIATEFAGSREPNDKPFVERFNRTFNYTFIHRLPGTTLAKLYKRIGFKAEKEACITLKELDLLIHTWILGQYHLRPHAGLGGRAPIDVWRESAASHPPMFKANAEQVEIEFAEIANSAVQHYGIDLNNERYASTRLTNLRRMLPEKAVRVDVKWPWHNLGRIHVWDPFEKEYFAVPNVDPDLEGVTLEQASAARKHIKGNDAYKSVRASVASVAREIVKAAEADKKLKNRKQGARLANKTSKDSRQPVTENVVDVSSPDIELSEDDAPITGFPVDIKN